jgi:hypothetical protein
VQIALALFGAALTCMRLLLLLDACMDASHRPLFFCDQFAVRAGDILRDFSLRGGRMEELRDLREGTSLRLHAD